MTDPDPDPPWSVIRIYALLIYAPPLLLWFPLQAMAVFLDANERRLDAVSRHEAIDLEVATTTATTLSCRVHVPPHTN